jgi:salicylate hydroxylase
MVDANTGRYWLIHRADYQQCLFDHAKKEGVKVLLNSFVERVDDAGPSVTLASGQTLAADIVIGADGIRSRTRECILGGEDVQPVDSSNCAFRATVPRQAMVEDATVAHLMDDINANCWIGHQRHIMAYPIRNGALYNLVMSHPGRAAVGRWNEPGDLAAMRQHYADFDPAVCRVLAKVSACLKWKLADLPPLPRWVSSTGRVVLIGDAAHAMVPYMAQGAAQSIEDGAALAECLERAGGDLAAVPAALGAFEQIRKPRCDVVQAASRSNGDIWHMPDGPAQERRDREMLGVMRGELNGSGDDESSAENPNRWSDESFQPWLFGYDTVAEVSLH